MTDSPKDIIAQAICDTSTIGRWFPWATLTDPQREPWHNMAQAALDALAAAGYEIVKLPEPNSEWVAEWVGNWGSLWVSGMNQPWRRIIPRPHSSYDSDEARNLAAALLAAAKTAENVDLQDLED